LPPSKTRRKSPLPHMEGANPLAPWGFSRHQKARPDRDETGPRTTERSLRTRRIVDFLPSCPSCASMRRLCQAVRVRTPYFLWRVPERHASIRTLAGPACDPVHVRVRRGAATFVSNSLRCCRLATGSLHKSQSPGRDVKSLCSENMDSL
jgi:hypothetical protein